MRITLSTGDASAIISNGECTQVFLHRTGMQPILPSRVTQYLKDGYPPTRALAACVAWKDGVGDEDVMMMGG